MELSVKKNPRKGSLENIDDFGSPPPGISLTTDNKVADPKVLSQLRMACDLVLLESLRSTSAN